MAHWKRVSVQWLGVGLAHAAVLGAALQAPPPPLRTPPRVIQASLIAPHPLVGLPEEQQEPPAPTPRKPDPPKPQKPPEKPKRQLVAAPAREDAPVPSYEVAQPPIDPPPSVPAETGSDSSTASPLASVGDSTAGALTPPVFNANYLENPPPPYPQLSRRNGETGRVLLRVFVSAEGRAERVEINKSSGFDRLDSAARSAVSGWRFVPARRGSERVAAWVLIPVSFVM
jgi:protein TonB